MHRAGIEPSGSWFSLPSFQWPWGFRMAGRGPSPPALAPDRSSSDPLAPGPPGPGPSVLAGRYRLPGHVEPRQALEPNVFDAVSFAFDPVGDLRVQRAPGGVRPEAHADQDVLPERPGALLPGFLRGRGDELAGQVQVADLGPAAVDGRQRVMAVHGVLRRVKPGVYAANTRKTLRRRPRIRPAAGTPRQPAGGTGEDGGRPGRIRPVPACRGPRSRRRGRSHSPTRPGRR